MFTINVLMITYKQEDVLRRTLDSVFLQKDDGLHEIVICDDCSPDHTWDVIQEYSERYPGYIRAYRNSPNLGIYANEQKVFSLRGDADFYTALSGDDALCDGWFNAIQKFAKEQCINPKLDACVIYSDWKTISPDGMTKSVHTNAPIQLTVPPQSLKIRGLISTRSTLITNPAVSRFKPVDTESGIPAAETRFEIQYAYCSDKNYYCPYIGSIYYSEIGVSTTVHTMEYCDLRIFNYSTLADFYKFDKKDKHYLAYLTSYWKCKSRQSVKAFINAIYHFVLSVRPGCNPDFAYSFRVFVSLFKSCFCKAI